VGLIFTYLMAYGGSVIALANPYVGFLIYVCFAVLKPGVGCWVWSVPNANYSKFLAAGVLIGWAIRGTGDWRFGRAWAAVCALVAYLAWNAISATQALVPEIAWALIDGQAKIILMVIVGLTLLDSVEKLKQLAWVILLSHAYVSYELNLDYFSGFNRMQEFGFGWLDNNSAAITLVTCIGLGIFLCLSAHRWWQKVLAAACVGVMVHAVMFSFSRGGMIGLVIVVSLSFLLIPKRPIHFLALTAGILLTLATTGPEVAKRFNSSFAADGERDASAQSRLDMWGICIRETGARPIFGLGPQHFHVHAHEFGLKAGKEAHTTWLQMAVEIGIPGVTLLLVFFMVALVRMWGLTRKSVPVQDPFFRDIARMVVAATTGYLFTAQFVTIPGIEAPYYIVLLGLGVLKLMRSPDLLRGPVPDVPTSEDTFR
jgi:probable O-glycosylation ligase (exosortase A-associated)